MSLKKTTITALMAVAGLAASQATFAQAAQDRGWYAGGSLGQSTADCDVSPFSCDDKDTSWKIFGGYQINRNFAVELGYANLGELTISGFGANITAESTAWDLVGVGIFPINNQFSVYGKLGFYRGTVDVSSNVGGSGDDSTNGVTFGAGARYNFSPKVGLQAEWQRYGKLEAPSGSALSGDSDIDVLSIGIVWKF
jgi:OOP family OmpA-OmpF porin